jgi:hypothetical protein
MNPRLALVTSTDTVELPLSYIPESLFSRVIETTMLRNQDSTQTFILTDELPVPHFFEFGATLHFDTETERYQYTEWLQSQVDDIQELIYDNSIVLPVSTGWLRYSIGTSNPVQLDVEMKFLPTELEWRFWYPDSILMRRDDILLSRSDITMETLRGE